MWQVVFAKAAAKDAKKLAAAGLKSRAQELLDVLANDPFQNPPPFEKLVGDLDGAYSRRINIHTALSTRCSRRSTPCGCFACGLTTSERSA
jgi:Txe/YoeB family toxin of toxin-antitoxin system